jgi:hypothetical protein
VHLYLPPIVVSSYDPTRRRIVYRFVHGLVSRWTRLVVRFLWYDICWQTGFEAQSATRMVRGNDEL